MKQLLGSPRISMIYISARTAGEVQEAQTQIDALMRQRHRIAPGQESDINMRSQEEIASTSKQTSKILSVLLGSAAAISLLVGGIGIMNIMLVSVTERTREIGVRLAIGAKGRHVLLQFLLEAIALSVVGGAIGVGLGILAPILVTRFAGLPTQVSSRAPCSSPSASPPRSASSSPSTRRARRLAAGSDRRPALRVGGRAAFDGGLERG
jgi:putative ABC transport system permease protein